MKNFTLSIFLAAITIGGIVLAQTAANPTLPNLGAVMTDASGRSCLFPPGGAEPVINCSDVAAASSAELKKWARYIVQCRSDSYWATGSAATGQDADASDLILPKYSIMEFITDSTSLYFSCLNVADDTDCRYMECL